MAIKKEISLLPESENPRSFFAKFFKWLTTTGRVTIIITELIVISVFISRFWLDRKNSDLSEIVRQKQTILQSAAPFENDFINLQKRLSFIKNFYSSQPPYDNQISTLIASTPDDLFYDVLSVSTDKDTSDTTISASLIAFKEDSIVSFINNLMLNPNISQVDVTRIEKKERENQYTVSITLLFSNKAAKPANKS